MRRLLLFALCLVLPTLAVSAPADSLTTAPHPAAGLNTEPDLTAALQKAKVGATLRVEGMGAPVVGRFDGIDRGGLQLREEQKRVSIPLESVTAVSRLESARGKGILWGALIGAGAGAVVASQRVDDASVTDDEHDWLTYAYYSAVGALLGGAIGGVIGSTFSSWQPVYP